MICFLTDVIGELKQRSPQVAKAMEVCLDLYKCVSGPEVRPIPVAGGWVGFLDHGVEDATFILKVQVDMNDAPQYSTKLLILS
jgi:hypothetical protein